MANKAIDWAKLGWCMTQSVQVGPKTTSMFANGRARFGAFKAQSDSVAAAHHVASNRSTKIDWASYKAALPAQAAWVASMEKQFNSAQVPKPADSLSAKIAADDEVFNKILEDTSAALDVAAGDAAADLNVLQSLPAANQMTMSDVYKFLPELNPFTDSEMEKHAWDPTWAGQEAITDTLEMEKAKRAEVKSLFLN